MISISPCDIVIIAISAMIGSCIFVAYAFTCFGDRRKYTVSRSFLIGFCSIYYLILISVKSALHTYAQHTSPTATFIPLFLLLLLELLMLYVCFRSPPWRLGAAIVFFHILQAFCYLIVSNGLLFIYAPEFSSGFPYTMSYMHELSAYGIYCLFVYLCVLLIEVGKRRKRKPRVKLRHTYLLFLPPILTALGTALVYPHIAYLDNNIASILIGLFLFLINVSVRSLYADLDRRAVKLTHLEIYHQKQEEYYAVLMENRRYIQKHLHDTKNHYGYMLLLLKRNDLEKLGEYILSMESGLNGISDLSVTGNTDMDTILSAKIFQAEKLGVKIEVHDILPPILNFDPVDICLVLGNCLDNALSACVLTNAPLIQVDFKYYKRLLVISVTNAYLKEPLQTPFNKTRSFKAEKQGMGLEIISAIAYKYGGNATFTGDGEIFTAEILLQEPDKSKDVSDIILNTD